MIINCLHDQQTVNKTSTNCQRMKIHVNSLSSFVDAVDKLLTLKYLNVNELNPISTNQQKNNRAKSFFKMNGVKR